MTSYTCRECGGTATILPSRPVPADRLCHRCETIRADRVATEQADIERLSIELASCRAGRLSQFHELSEAKAKLQESERDLDRIGDWLAKHVPKTLADHDFDRCEAVLDVLVDWQERRKEIADA